MEKVIGITGHRGAGKTTVAWLLGNCIESLLNKREITKESYKQWVNEIMSYERIIFESDLGHIYFDSFQDSILNIISMFTGIPYLDMVSDDRKDSMIINLKDFEYRNREELDITTPAKVILAERKDESIKPIDSDTWMTLREFIIYFGHDVMKRFFGENIWVKALQKSPIREFTRSDWVIFVDTKTRAEQQYILDRGILINVSRVQNYKKDSEITCPNRDLLNQCEYNIIITDDLMDTFPEILNIAKDILNKFKNAHGND